MGAIIRLTQMHEEHSVSTFSHYFPVAVSNQRVEETSICTLHFTPLKMQMQIKRSLESYMINTRDIDGYMDTVD